MKVVTNNVPRLLLYWYELTDEEKKEFDWMNEPEDGDFFRYKGAIYCTEMFVRGENNPWTGNRNPYPGWDGYHQDSFFSAVLVKFVEDGDKIVVGWAIS